MSEWVVRLSEQTAAIFKVVADSQHLPMAVVMEQCLMRDAAIMSSRPGEIAVKCRLALREIADEGRP